MRVTGIAVPNGRVAMIDVPKPRPLAADEALIRVRAAGVGNWDEIVRTGDWDVGAIPPMALGVEAAGVLTAIGDQVGEWAVGDEVMTHPLPLRDQGAWAPWLIAPAALLARKPAAMSWEAAAAFPVPALTAHQVVVETLDIRPGETLLVHCAGGVTGSLLVSLAAIRGAVVLATASPASHERLRELGAAHVLDYHDDGWPEQVRRVTGGTGVDAAANAARHGAAAAIATVRAGGRLATITSDPPGEQREITISSVYVRSDGRQLGMAAELAGAGKLRLEVGRTFPPDEAAGALAAAAGGTGGTAVALVF